MSQTVASISTYVIGAVLTLVIIWAYCQLHSLRSQEKYVRRFLEGAGQMLERESVPDAVKGFLSEWADLIRDKKFARLLIKVVQADEPPKVHDSIIVVVNQMADPDRKMFYGAMSAFFMALSFKTSDGEQFREWNPGWRLGCDREACPQTEITSERSEPITPC